MCLNISLFFIFQHWLDPSKRVSQQIKGEFLLFHPPPPQPFTFGISWQIENGGLYRGIQWTRGMSRNAENKEFFAINVKNVECGKTAYQHGIFLLIFGINVNKVYTCLQFCKETCTVSPIKYWFSPLGVSPITLYLGVKFYAADPCKLIEEITRYQFFLQVI